MVFGMIPIGFGRFPIRMGWKWVANDGKGYANTTYISELHLHIPAGWIFQKKKGCRAAAAGFRRRPAARFFENSSRPGCGDGIRGVGEQSTSDRKGRQPAALFFGKSGRPGCGDGIRRCRLCSHILCHQLQPISSPF